MNKEMLFQAGLESTASWLKRSVAISNLSTSVVQVIRAPTCDQEIACSIPGINGGYWKFIKPFVSHFAFKIRRPNQQKIAIWYVCKSLQHSLRIKYHILAPNNKIVLISIYNIYILWQALLHLAKCTDFGQTWLAPLNNKKIK